MPRSEIERGSIRCCCADTASKCGGRLGATVSLINPNVERSKFFIPSEFRFYMPRILSRCCSRTPRMPQRCVGCLELFSAFVSVFIGVIGAYVFFSLNGGFDSIGTTIDASNAVENLGSGAASLFSFPTTKLCLSSYTKVSTRPLLGSDADALLSPSGLNGTRVNDLCIEETNNGLVNVCNNALSIFNASQNCVASDLRVKGTDLVASPQGIGKILAYANLLLMMVGIQALILFLFTKFAVARFKAKAQSRPKAQSFSPRPGQNNTSNAQAKPAVAKKQSKPCFPCCCCCSCKNVSKPAKQKDNKGPICIQCCEICCDQCCDTFVQCFDQLCRCDPKYEEDLQSCLWWFDCLLLPITIVALSFSTAYGLGWGRTEFAVARVGSGFDVFVNLPRCTDVRDIYMDNVRLEQRRAEWESNMLTSTTTTATVGNQSLSQTVERPPSQYNTSYPKDATLNPVSSACFPQTSNGDKQFHYLLVDENTNSVTEGETDWEWANMSDVFSAMYSESNSVSNESQRQGLVLEVIALALTLLVLILECWSSYWKSYDFYLKTLVSGDRDGDDTWRISKQLMAIPAVMVMNKNEEYDPRVPGLNGVAHAFTSKTRTMEYVVDLRTGDVRTEAANRYYAPSRSNQQVGSTSLAATSPRSSRSSKRQSRRLHPPDGAGQIIPNQMQSPRAPVQAPTLAIGVATTSHTPPFSTVPNMKINSTVTTNQQHQQQQNSYSTTPSINPYSSSQQPGGVQLMAHCRYCGVPNMYLKSANGPVGSIAVNCFACGGENRF